MLTYDKQRVAELLDTFIWSYNVGDNICYNFKVLFTLYDDQQSSANSQIYNKPQIILIVSIIECLMYDLVTRMDGATGHWPTQIPPEKKAEIKARLEREKETHTYDHLGETMEVQRVRNYSMARLVKLFQDYEFFGSDMRVYDALQTAVRLRNRVHIFNWFGNFERKEQDTYSNEKVATVERLLEGVLFTLSHRYPRPSPAGQVDSWIGAMTNE